MGLFIIGAPLAIGGVHYETLGILAVGALVMDILVVRKVGRAWGLHVDPLMLVFACTALWGFLTVIPLPSDLLRLISPGAHAVWEGAIRPLGAAELQSWMSISLDPPETAVQILKIFICLSVYASVVHFRKKRGRSFIACLTAVSGSAIAIVMLFHQLSGLSRIFGFYKPLFSSVVPVFAPFVNPNHLAGALNLTIPVTVGLGLEEDRTSRRLVWLALAGLMSAAMFLTLSRGGIAAFIAGQIIFAGLLLRKRTGTSSWLRFAWVPAGIVFIIASGFYVAQEQVVAEYAEGNLSKINLWLEGASLIPSFPWTGSGMGTFWMVFPHKSDILPAAGVSFTSVESMPVQALIELGIPIGTAVLVLLALPVLRSFFRGPSGALKAGVIAALAASGLHNITDFNLDIAGVFIIAAAVLGMCTSISKKSKSSRFSFHIKGVRAYVLTSMTAVLILITLYYALEYNLEKETHRLFSAYAQGEVEPFAPEKIEPVIKRHPADYYVPLLAGMSEYAGGGKPLAWINRALELNPRSGQAHLYAARTLAGMGRRSQALLEYSRAAVSSGGWDRRVAVEIVKLWPQYDLLREFPAYTDSPVLFLDLIARELQKMGLFEEAEKTDADISRMSPEHPGYLKRSAERMMKSGDYEKARKTALRLQEADPTDFHGDLYLMKALNKDGKTQEAVDTGRRAVKKFGTISRIVKELADVLATAGRKREALETIKQLEISARSQKQRVDALVARAVLERKMGDYSAAMNTLRTASLNDPHNHKILSMEVRLAVNQKDYKRALQLFRALSRLEPEKAEWKKRALEIENLLKKQLFLHEDGQKEVHPENAH